MDAARVALHPAFVIHARPFRDNGAILDIITADHGRFALMARGVRGARSRWKNVLVPFQPLLVSWQRRSEMGSLVAAEPASAAFALSKDWLYSGFYVNELMQRLVPRDDPCPGVFDVYRATLAALAGESAIEPTLRRFEKHLLDDLGHGCLSDIASDTGSPVADGQNYWFSAEFGVTETIKPGAVSCAGRTVQAISNNQWEMIGDWSEVKRLHRVMLAKHLGNKPLRSRELFAVRSDAFEEVSR